VLNDWSYWKLKMFQLGRRSATSQNIEVKF
jgi:hypothetical protein